MMDDDEDDDDGDNDDRGDAHDNRDVDHEDNDGDNDDDACRTMISGLCHSSTPIGADAFIQ